MVLEKVSWKQWMTFIQAKTQSRVSVEVEVEARHGGGSDGEKIQRDAMRWVVSRGTYTITNSCFCFRVCTIVQTAAVYKYIEHRTHTAK